MILTRESGPENELIGSWQEVSWEYAKVNHSGGLTDFSVEDSQREEIVRNLIIHKAEKWSFTPDHHLELLTEQGKVEDLVWNVKGRGHILELQHSDLGLEDYQIQELTGDSLVIHFSFDLQMRGIVKMTFKRSSAEEYAQKI
jgi:hypothetical protein